MPTGPSLCLTGVCHARYNPGMSHDTLVVSPAAARRFLVTSFGLDAAPADTPPDVASVLRRLEFLQMDSINVCGRIHDLILWSRLPGYRERDLADFLYGTSPRTAFEYYFPNLSILPLDEYPYFAAGMRRHAATEGRWGALTPEEQAVAEQVLARIDADGPLRTRATSGAEHGHTISAWGTRTKVFSHVTEKLFLHGRLGVARRDNFERTFDRAERLYPAETLAAALPDEEEERRFRAQKRLKARRLFRANAKEVAALGKGALVTVRIEGQTRTWQVLAEDTDALRRAESTPVPDTVNLLAPLDPLVYDRQRTLALFDFEYIWEVYTPEAKRRWGYYVLPILWGDRLAGRGDPKIDRKAKTLTLHRLSLEPGVDAAGIAPGLAARLREFAGFLGAERIDLPRVEPEALRTALRKQGL